MSCEQPAAWLIVRTYGSNQYMELQLGCPGLDKPQRLAANPPPAASRLQVDTDFAGSIISLLVLMSGDQYVSLQTAVLRNDVGFEPRIAA
ncbi:hypothetical protein D3C75_1206440 [compost metagenome]